MAGHSSFLSIVQDSFLPEIQMKFCSQGCSSGEDLGFLGVAFFQCHDTPSFHYLTKIVFFKTSRFSSILKDLLTRHPMKFHFSKLLLPQKGQTDKIVAKDNQIRSLFQIFQTDLLLTILLIFDRGVRSFEFFQSLYTIYSNVLQYQTSLTSITKVNQIGNLFQIVQTD